MRKGNLKTPILLIIHEIHALVALYRTGKRRTFGPDCSGLCSGATDRHGQENSQEFHPIHLPEIISAWTLTGEADYLLRVYCFDLCDLNRLIHEALLKSPVCRG